jgi:flavin reductase (DIM6/NTAB) family NADH-FMN oxidoreductase RutF
VIEFAPAEMRRFRQACAQFATGVTAVTARAGDGELAALTANSFTSVSLDPPLVLVCVGVGMSAFEPLSRADRMAIHVLTAGQEEVARRLATSGLDGAGRLHGLDWEPDAAGTPVIADSAARIAGPIVERVAAGDHEIFLVGAETIEIAEGFPRVLVFHRTDFATTQAMAA